MYSESLEQLIQSVIADGVISEKERAVLHKKAVAEGVDEDEIDVYVDGLLAKTAQATAGAAPSHKHDLTQVSKLTNDRATYYEMSKPLNLTPKNVPIKNLQYTFVDIENNTLYPKRQGLGIHIFGIIPNDYFISRNPTFTIKTDRNTFQISTCLDHYIFQNTKINGEFAGFNFGGLIDTEILGELCLSKTFNITINNITITRHAHHDDEKNFNISQCSARTDFAQYAQVAYRSMVDCTAYPDATIKEGGEEQVVVPVDDNETIARLLCMNPKNLVPIDTDVPCYNQYRDPNSKITIYHIDDSKKLNGQVQSLNKTLHYQFTLYLHAIAKDNEKPQFFFELTCSGGQTSDKEGKHSRKIPFGLVPGDIFLTIGINEYFINALTENTRAMEEQLGRMIKADEHCFYPIKDSVIQQLIQANTFEIVARNEIGNSGRLKPILGNLSMQKKWILSYNILTYPEQKEQLLQEYDDSKVSTKLIKGIKGLFGKK